MAAPTASTCRNLPGCQRILSQVPGPISSSIPLPGSLAGYQWQKSSGGNLSTSPGGPSHAARDNHLIRHLPSRQMSFKTTQCHCTCLIYRALFEQHPATSVAAKATFCSCHCILQAGFGLAARIRSIQHGQRFGHGASFSCMKASMALRSSMFAHLI